MAESVFSQLSADLLRQGYRVRFRATGESMHPTIRAGETVTVEPVARGDVRFADIILYRSGEALVAHRVAGRGAPAAEVRTFLVRGDAADGYDVPVEEGQVLGRVVTVERGGRSIPLDSWRGKICHLLRVLAYRLKRRVDDIGS